MKQNTFIFACLCSAAAIAVVIAVPVPASNQELDVLQIPLGDGKEIDVLTVGSKDQEQMISERNRRTVGLLRELFPDITKEINLQIDRIVQTVLAKLGPGILGNALNSRNGNAPQSSLDAENYSSDNQYRALDSSEIVYKPDEAFETNEKEKR